MLIPLISGGRIGAAAKTTPSTSMRPRGAGSASLASADGSAGRSLSRRQAPRASISPFQPPIKYSAG